VRTLLLSTVFALAPLAAFAQNAAPATVVDLVASNEDLSTLARVLGAAGLLETLAGEGPLTVFAPTNEAFEALPEGELERLLGNPEELAEVLSYHVTEGRVLAGEVAGFADDSSSQQPLETLQGGTLNLAPRENTDKSIYVNDAALITEADLAAGNGVVHVIDAVLLPSGRVAGELSGGAMTGGSPTGQ
jgi:uncharacterized surface protein with fasciclin (FAS1) repeats